MFIVCFVQKIVQMSYKCILTPVTTEFEPHCGVCLVVVGKGEITYIVTRARVC